MSRTGWVGGLVSNSPRTVGVDICGSVGLPTIWVGGVPQITPPPVVKKNLVRVPMFRYGTSMSHNTP